MLIFQIAQKYRVFISAVLAVVLFYLARPTLSSILWGIPLVLFGEFIRTWSSGNIRKNKALATDGPYAYTRNPLYLGSFFIGTGFAVMAHSLVVFAVFTPAFFLIYWGVIRSEEWDLSRAFGPDFEAYVRNVPRFFPRLTRGAYGPGKFDWALVWRHREYNAWMGIAAAVAILFIKMTFQG
ncbi:MAG TPA: isoprenylcysteine carboxylmethyltransferase family protein, partial [Nitrospiria bacterium]|nr:isoprenylcysteine carboxylmethyltransferase family protein [Nitrospiria bacterium]